MYAFYDGEKNMTESEKRREELLRRARTIYSDKKTPPAVHPRYRSLYTKLYDLEPESDPVESHSTLGVRIFIAILLFALFVAMDYKGTEYATVDSKKIIREIERQVDID